MSPLIPPSTKTRGTIGGLSRSRSEDDPELLNARRDHRAARLAEYVQRAVDAAPPLTAEQRDFIAGILRSTRGQGAA